MRTLIIKSILSTALLLTSLIGLGSTPAITLVTEPSDLEAIRAKLRFYYVDDPTQLDVLALSNGTMATRSKAPAFWKDTELAPLQRLIGALVESPANGGDLKLQYFVARILRVTEDKRPILILLWNERDSANLDDQRIRILFKPQIDTATATVHPTAEYLPERIFGGYPSLYSGVVHLGAAYFRGANWKNSLATFVHELMHTQSQALTLKSAFRFPHRRQSYRYGADGTHLGMEIIPDKRAAYAEAIADVFEFTFNAVGQTSLDNVIAELRKGAFLIERTPDFLRQDPTLADQFRTQDLLLYEMLLKEGKRGRPIPRNGRYMLYSSTDLPARYMFQNELVLAASFALADHYGAPASDPFIWAVQQANRELSHLSANSEGISAVAVLVNHFARALQRDEIDYSKELADLEANGIDPLKSYNYLLPLAYLDYFSWYQSKDFQDFQAAFSTGVSSNPVFSSDIDDSLLRIYWDHFRDKVKLNVPAGRLSNVEDARPIAWALGVEENYTEDRPSFLHETEKVIQDHSQDWVHSVDAWESLTVKGVKIPIYNATSAQRSNILKTLNRLPEQHIRSIPNIIVTSAAGKIDFLRKPLTGADALRQTPPNRAKEWIKLSADALKAPRNRNVNRTLLHVIGHFINRDFNIWTPNEIFPNSANDDIERACKQYLADTNFQGHSNSPSEAIAQVYMYYFSYTTAGDRKVQANKLIPDTMLKILKDSDAWRGNESWK